MHSIHISEIDKKILLRIARHSIASYLGIKIVPGNDDVGEFPYSGAFVSLYHHKKLRGCIGRFSNKQKIANCIEDLARLAAFNDTRFAPITMDEWPRISIEISILTPLKRLSTIDEIELGKHGIYIKSGMNSGTFLPQVAEKTNWTKEEFLGHCSRDKAGIGWEGWKNAEVYCYEAVVFSE